MKREERRRRKRLREMVDACMQQADIFSWIGLTPTTINSYMERSGRFIKRTAEAMKEQFIANPSM